MNRIILLVYAPVFCHSTRRLRPPLGLLYLGSTLLNHNYKVKLFDFQDERTSWLSLDEEIDRWEHCLIGFSCDSDNIQRVLRKSDRLLALSESTTVVLGGPHVSHIWEPYVKARRIVVRGEGEYPLLLLARYFLEGEGSLAAIPGIAYEEDGSLHCNPISLGPFEDVNALPFPDYSLLPDDGKYVPVVATSRGCAYNCYFCSEGNRSRGYRPRTIDNVEKELIDLKARRNGSVPFLALADDTFTASPKRVGEMCDLFDRVFPDKSQFGFFCEGRVNILAKDLDMIDRLKAAGLIRMQIGIESGDQEMLKRINKKTRLEQIEQVVARCYEAGVPALHGVFICGLPGQTESHILKDIEFAKHLADLAPGRIELGMVALSPLPGTEFRNNAHRWGIQILDEDFVTGGLLDGCFSETETLSKTQIEQLCHRFNAEIDRYVLEKCSFLQPDEIKKLFILAADRAMFAWLVRKLCCHIHVDRLLSLRYREDHRFLQEIPGRSVVSSCPLRIRDNLISFSEGRYTINEDSPFHFHLNPDEMAYYEYFNGKLSFREIARHKAAKSGENETSALAECKRIYGLCEDKLAAIMMT